MINGLLTEVETTGMIFNLIPNAFMISIARVPSLFCCWPMEEDESFWGYKAKAASARVWVHLVTPYCISVLHDLEFWKGMTSSCQRT